MPSSPSAALADLTKILNIRGTPIMTRVYRWNRSSPQQEVGHGELMRRIDAGLAGHRGLFISAAGFRGVGIPDSIADARHTATTAAAFVRERFVDENGELFLEAFTTMMGHEGDNSISLKYDTETGQVVRTPNNPKTEPEPEPEPVTPDPAD